VRVAADLSVSMGREQDGGSGTRDPAKRQR
jgi:hypothetical protein